MSRPEALTIARLHKPSPRALDAAIRSDRPVILTGLMDDSTAARCWDLGYLRDKLGTRPVSVVTHDQPRLHWDPGQGLPIRPQAFADFAAQAFGPQPSGYSYLQDDVNNLPGLQKDYELPPMMAAKGIKRGKFWLSGRGLVTPLHYDPVETFHWVIRGSKRFVAYRPGVDDYYPYPASSTAPFISQVDPDDPQPARFPRFARAVPMPFQLGEGEILYLPAFWWHQVYSEAPLNLSLNFVWFASRVKTWLRHGQWSRAKAHVARQVAKVKAQEQAARIELQRAG